MRSFGDELIFFFMFPLQFLIDSVYYLNWRTKSRTQIVDVNTIYTQRSRRFSEFVNEVSTKFRKNFERIRSILQFSSHVTLDKDVLSFLNTSRFLSVDMVRDLDDMNEVYFQFYEEDMKKNKFDLVRLVEEEVGSAEKWFRMNGQEKHLKFDVVKRSDFPPLFVGDKKKVRHLISNFLRNIIKLYFQKEKDDDDEEDEGEEEEEEERRGKRKINCEITITLLWNKNSKIFSLLFDSIGLNSNNVAKSRSFGKYFLSLNNNIWTDFKKRKKWSYEEVRRIIQVAPKPEKKTDREKKEIICHNLGHYVSVMILRELKGYVDFQDIKKWNGLRTSVSFPFEEAIGPSTSHSTTTTTAPRPFFRQYHNNVASRKKKKKKARKVEEKENKKKKRPLHIFILDDDDVHRTLLDFYCKNEVKVIETTKNTITTTSSTKTVRRSRKEENEVHVLNSKSIDHRKLLDDNEPFILPDLIFINKNFPDDDFEEQKDEQFLQSLAEKMGDTKNKNIRRRNIPVFICILIDPDSSSNNNNNNDQEYYPVDRRKKYIEYLESWMRANDTYFCMSINYKPFGYSNVNRMIDEVKMIVYEDKKYYRRRRMKFEEDEEDIIDINDLSSSSSSEDDDDIDFEEFRRLYESEQYNYPIRRNDDINNDENTSSLFYEPQEEEQKIVYNFEYHLLLQQQKEQRRRRKVEGSEESEDESEILIDEVSSRVNPRKISPLGMIRYFATELLESVETGFSELFIMIMTYLFLFPSSSTSGKYYMVLHITLEIFMPMIFDLFYYNIFSYISLPVTKNNNNKKKKVRSSLSRLFRIYLTRILTTWIIVIFFEFGAWYLLFKRSYDMSIFWKPKLVGVSSSKSSEFLQPRKRKKKRERKRRRGIENERRRRLFVLILGFCVHYMVGFLLIFGVITRRNRIFLFFGAVSDEFNFYSSSCIIIILLLSESTWKMFKMFESEENEVALNFKFLQFLEKRISLYLIHVSEEWSSLILQFIHLDQRKDRRKKTRTIDQLLEKVLSKDDDNNNNLILLKEFRRILSRIKLDFLNLQILKCYDEIYYHNQHLIKKNEEGWKKVKFKIIKKKKKVDVRTFILRESMEKNMIWGDGASFLITPKFFHKNHNHKNLFLELLRRIQNEHFMYDEEVFEIRFSEGFEAYVLKLREEEMDDKFEDDDDWQREVGVERDFFIFLTVIEILYLNAMCKIYDMNQNKKIIINHDLINDLIEISVGYCGHSNNNNIEEEEDYDDEEEEEGEEDLSKLEMVWFCCEEVVKMLENGTFHAMKDGKITFTFQVPRSYGLFL